MKPPDLRTRRSVLLPVAAAVPLAAQRRRAYRGIRGRVTDQRQRPLPGASVRLKNLQTLRIRSYLTRQDGSFRFNVPLGAEFELFAVFKGRRSDVKAIRWYDEGADLEVNFVIDTSGPADR